jgi:Ca2+/H+ antiporter, TMEM165/GDT1 family
MSLTVTDCENGRNLGRLCAVDVIAHFPARGGLAVNPTVLLTAFFATAIEVIEMVAIVVGVGVARSWRAALMGASAGLIVLAVLVAVLGTAVRDVPLSPVRLVVGALLLVFGLQWLRKGVLRVARDGWGVGHHAPEVDSTDVAEHRFDWTGFALSFKGVSLEGLEVAVIVVAFGAAAGAVGSAVVGAAAAIIVLGAVGALTYRLVARVPRRALQLFVGALLTTFGTFWAAEGLGWRGQARRRPCWHWVPSTFWRRWGC